MSDGPVYCLIDGTELQYDLSRFGKPGYRCPQCRGWWNARFPVRMTDEQEETRHAP